MQYHTVPFSIYPSQLKTFKSKAKALSTELTRLEPSLRLSAFQRNDYLSIALGYKGHSDLVTSASFRSSSHNEEELELFSNCLVRRDIINTFLSKIPQITEEQISYCCLLLSENLGRVKSRGISQILASCTLEDIHSLINGVLTDVSSGRIWDGRASVWMRSILSVLVYRRDKQGVSFSIAEIRNLLSISNVKAVSDELRENGVKDKVLLNYFIEIGEGAHAEERHAYYESLLDKVLSMIEKESATATN